MDTQPNEGGLSLENAFLKRGFDLLASSVGLLLTWWIIVLAAAAATIDTGRSGFFLQRRIGRGGYSFVVIKIRTMRPISGIDTTVTTAQDARITPLGRFLRKTKVDELPQLINVLLGQMSFVGPRPDMPGFADRLEGEDRLMLTIRPGITGPATLKYRNEEAMLASQEDPEKYNREVIWPDKVKINCDYVREWSLRNDLHYIWITVVGRE